MTNFKFGRDVSPDQRLPVSWYQPDVLWKAAQEMLSSTDLMRNRDAREGFTLPLTVIDLSNAPTKDGFWFDFISDVGDGGNATYEVARRALAQHCECSTDKKGQTVTLPRGELLLFGGDLAYPGASPNEYRYRFIEMYEAARTDGHIAPDATAQVRKGKFTIAAIPQNHDWMDSISTFSRYFIRDKSSRQFLQAKIPQKQSYFCVKLPGNWWVLGLDFGVTGDIDRDQYNEFWRLLSSAPPPTAALAKSPAPAPAPSPIGEDDQVIVIYPEPYWTRMIGDGAEPGRQKRYQLLEAELGERLKIRLAGDLHHYVHWASPAGANQSHLITCGTGGAFTHPTHTKRTTGRIVQRAAPNPDPVISTDGAAVHVGRINGEPDSGDLVFKRDAARDFPQQNESRAKPFGNFAGLRKRWPNTTNEKWQLPEGNWQFAAFLGVLYWFNAYLNSLPFVDTFAPDNFKPMWRFAPTFHDYASTMVLWLKAMVFSPLGFVVNVVMIVACVLMGREAHTEFATWGKLKTALIGVAHAAVHVVAIYSLEFWIQQGVGQLPYIGHPLAGAWDAIGHAILVGLLMLLIGSFVGWLIFSTYLTIMSYTGYLTNNGFSAMGIEDYKGFLRFKIDAHGTLHGHFVSLKQVPKSWTKSSAGSGPVWPVWKPDPEAQTLPRVHDRFEIRSRPRA